MRASLPSNLPWIRSVMIVGGDGRIQCSTTNMYVGVDLSDRPYLIKARETRNFAFSEFLLARPTNTPMIMAAYPVSAIDADADSVVLAAINLDWLSKIMNNLGGRTGVSSVLVDSAGTVLAAPADQADAIGKPLDFRAAALGDRPQSAGLRRVVRIAYIRGRRWLEPPGEFCADPRHTVAPDRQH